jgi:hypothetical protein
MKEDMSPEQLHLIRHRCDSGEPLTVSDLGELIKGIRTRSPDFDGRHVSDAYLVARYDASMGQDAPTQASTQRQDAAQEPSPYLVPRVGPGQIVGDRRFDSADKSEDTIEPEVAQRAMYQRNANAWRGTPSSATRAVETRSDAARVIDPDESARRMRKRNEEAWKGKSGVEMLETLEKNKNEDGESGVGAFGMRHTRT